MGISDDELLELEALLKEQAIYEGKDDLFKFTKATFPKFVPAQFHENYYDLVDAFAKKKVKNLIISMPPQHGKSECSSRRLPAYIAGLRPEDKQALICYNSSKAQKFGREIMTIMREPDYKGIFPDVQYPDRGYTGAKSNTNMERESINSRGSMKFVGVNGPLTGDPVDVLLMDDLYKDWAEANSPIIRDSVWDWYTSVADTRLHNGSQQLIVFTRWHEDDLVGRLQRLGKVVELDLNRPIEEQIEALKHDEFLRINLEAIQTKQASKIDPREIGEALWPERHSKEKLLSAKEKNETQFQCLYQGDPQDKKGLLYSGFETYVNLPQLAIKKAYIDTADKGTDFLCGIVYGVPVGGSEDVYILDVLYSQEPMEYTEPETVNLLNRNNVHEAMVESNNGGRGFARVVEKGVRTEIITFTQSKNKEARILTNSSEVQRRVKFPDDWQFRWPEFYEHTTKFKKLFGANKHDDCVDALTGVVESNEIDSAPLIVW
jgi:predicted phage terminase large subunit-like protein